MCEQSLPCEASSHSFTELEVTVTDDDDDDGDDGDSAAGGGGDDSSAGGADMVTADQRQASNVHNQFPLDN